ncbi:response regulator [Croceicoccus ponticola]|uniref:Response regulator n=1 Tax=Croceicoccus ponticola TaxID=2217664 RepID=A0A437H1U0_9SPHN|nr:response regulator [Croceicoccus ponticola]RVQ69595.1 response regulator [Croceicoccus ponticola]
MGHALIIDDDIAIRRAMQKYLEPLGFESFDHTWTRQQALAAADRRLPDIIVIGDAMEEISALDAVQRISAEASIPVLLVSRKPIRAPNIIQRASSCEGPFRMDQIDTAVNVALCRRGSLH